MEKQNKLEKEKALEENVLKKKIKEAYHEKVVTNKDTNLYKLERERTCAGAFFFGLLLCEK